MAITTIDGALAGAQQPWCFRKVTGTLEAAGVWHSTFYNSGVPGAAAAPSPGMAGAALTSYAGQLGYSNPVSGNSYMMRFSGVGTLLGTLMLADRLWHNSGIAVTTTTAQTVNSASWPARDINGSTNGENILVGIEVSTATTNAGAVTNTTMSYTDQSGNAGATATMASFPATAVAGTFVPFQLAAGDTGVRSIQTVTLGTSYGAGAIHLVAYRVLAILDLPIAFGAQALNCVESGFVRAFDNTVPFLLWLPNGTTAVNIDGTIQWTHG